MRPVGTAGIGVEVHRARSGRHIGSARRVGRLGPSTFHGGIAIGEVEPVASRWPGMKLPRQMSKPGLHAEPYQPASGARVGERLVAVVDLLTRRTEGSRNGPTPSTSAPAFSSVSVSPMRSCSVPSMVSPICRAIGCTTPSVASSGPIIGKTPGGRGAGGGSVGNGGKGGSGPGGVGGRTVTGGTTGGIVPGGTTGGITGGTTGGITGGTTNSERRNQSLGLLPLVPPWRRS